MTVYIVLQAEALYSSAVFWFGLVLVPVVTLLFDILYKAWNNTGYSNVVDTVRRMEGMGIHDLDVFLNVVKPRPLLNNDTPLGALVEPSTSQGGHPRGYAFSQDESGAVSQANIVSMYGSTDNIPNRGRMQRLSVNNLTPKRNSNRTADSN